MSTARRRALMGGLRASAALSAMLASGSALAAGLPGTPGVEGSAGPAWVLINTRERPDEESLRESTSAAMGLAGHWLFTLRGPRPGLPRRWFMLGPRLGGLALGAAEPYSRFVELGVMGALRSGTASATGTRFTFGLGPVYNFADPPPRSFEIRHDVHGAWGFRVFTGIGYEVRRRSGFWFFESRASALGSGLHEWVMVDERTSERAVIHERLTTIMLEIVAGYSFGGV